MLAGEPVALSGRVNTQEKFIIWYKSRDARLGDTAHQDWTTLGWPGDDSAARCDLGRRGKHGPPQTLLCKTSCTAPSPYAAGTALKASLAEGAQAQLLTTFGNVQCKSSTIAGKTTAESGKPLPLEVSEVTFGECKLEGVTTCTATTTSLPTSPSLEASGEGNGTLSLEGGEVHFICGSSIDCTYKTPALQVKGGAPASLSAVEVALTKVAGSFLCPKTAKFDATYTVSEPNPAYLVM